MKQMTAKAQRGFSILAIIITLLFGTIATGIGLVSITSSLGDEVYAEDPVQWRIDHEEADRGATPPFSKKFLLLFLGLSVLIDVASGYIAGRIGRDTPVFHATVAGILIIVIGILLHPMAGHDPYPSWFNAITYLSTLPLMIIGGWMASQD